LTTQGRPGTTRLREVCRERPAIFQPFNFYTMKIFCLIEGGILQHIAVQGAEAPEIYVMDRDNGDLYPYAQAPGTYTRHETAVNFYADMQESCNPPAGFVWPVLVIEYKNNQEEARTRYQITAPTDQAGIFSVIDTDHGGQRWEHRFVTADEPTPGGKAISFFELPETVRLAYEFWAVNTEGQEAGEE